MRDKFMEMHVFPKPLSEEFLRDVKEWESVADDIDEQSLALAEMHAQAEPEVELEVLHSCCVLLNALNGVVDAFRLFACCHDNAGGCCCWKSKPIGGWFLYAADAATLWRVWKLRSY